jgi:FkbM family methyltransferase
MLKKIKNYYRYSKLHFYILRFKNPAYIKYLKNEFNFYRTFLLKNKLIFDLGANLGDKSHVFLKFTDRIILYEPEEDLYERLKFRFRKNNKVFINDLLISDLVGDVVFNSVVGNEAYSSIVENYKENFNHLKESSVVKKIKKSSTLNFEINKYGIPYYIKIDCEGAENLILKNLKYDIDIISFEANLPLFLNQTTEIINYLKNNFNRCYNIRKEGEFNFLFKNHLNFEEIIENLIYLKQPVEIFSFKK